MASHRRRNDVLQRLARIEGHVHGVKKMVEAERECPDILLQISAIRRSLDKVGKIVMEDHIESCLSNAVRKGKIEQYVSDLTEALSKFV